MQNRPYRKDIPLKYKLLNSFVNVYTLEDKKSDTIPLKKVSQCCNNEVGYKNYCKVCKNDTEVNKELKGYWKGRGKAKEFMTFDSETVAKMEQFDNGIEIMNWVKFEKIKLSNFGRTYKLEIVEGKELYQLIKEISKKGLVPICKTILSSKPHFSILRVEEGAIVIQQLIRTNDVTIEEKEVSIPKEYMTIFEGLIKKDTIKAFNFDDFRLEHIEKLKDMLESGTIATVKIEAKVTKQPSQLEQLKAMLEVSK